MENGREISEDGVDVVLSSPCLPALDGGTVRSSRVPAGSPDLIARSHRRVSQLVILRNSV